MKASILGWNPLLILLFCIISIISGVPCNEKHPEVEAPVGKIRGSVSTSRLGKTIYSFRGIRYAEPPVGRRRFEVATPVADWTNVLDASREGPSCPSIGGKNISEDCLRLNVYISKMPSENEPVGNFIRRKPVLVFFHPGGFYTSSAQSRKFGPEYLLDRRIVLVTVNYRLGSLGFMSTDDDSVPRNLGLKDQVVALRWVQRNIASFGGNPNSVTIGGYSVGGLSVLMHMLSPMSKNLFHRAISMSGSLLTPQDLPTEQKNLAKKQARLLNCPTDNTSGMLKCLRSKPVESFTDTLPKFFEWHGDPIIIWKPVVEPASCRGERFLTAQPIELIKKRRFHQVPLIAGVTKDEFGGVVVHLEEDLKNKNGTGYRDLNEKWETLAPISFLYERGSPRSKEITNMLRKFYFRGRPISSSNSKALAHAYSDSVIIYPTYSAVKLISANSMAPVYLYKFTYEGRYSSVMWDKTTPYGVVHHDDLQYLFTMKDDFPVIKEGEPESRMIDLYVAMWTHFMKSGKPICGRNPLLKDIRWKRFSARRNNYLDINLEPVMKTNFYPQRMKMWENIFPVDPIWA